SVTTCSVTVLTSARLGIAAGSRLAAGTTGSVTTASLRPPTALLVVVCLGTRQHGSAALTITDDLAVEDPRLDTDHAVGSAGPGGAVVAVGPQGLQGHTAVCVPLRARLFGATEATGAADLHAAGSRLHGALDCLLHGPPEREAPFELLGYTLRDER